MEKAILHNILAQNKMTSHYSFDSISNENLNLRLNKNTASIGFIYRHIGETMNLFTGFFGVSTGIMDTTIGRADTGQGKNLVESRKMISQGYDLLRQIIDETTEDEWLSLIDTPFFGKVTKVRLFSHILFHNSYHAGQISMTLSKGEGVTL